MATPNILKIQADVRAAGIPVTGSPTVVVRKITGTNTPSQHSFGNAIDFYPTDARQAADAKRGIRVESLERLYAYLDSHPLARTVCYYRRGGCTTAHLDHVHVDAIPKITSQAQLDKVLGVPVSDESTFAEDFKRGFERSTGINIGGDISEELNPIGEVTTGIEAVGGFLAFVTSAEFVKRASLVVGGSVVVILGLYFIGKEFGLPSATSVAKTAATKGLA